jgi:hypothetical protein
MPKNIILIVFFENGCCQNNNTKEWEKTMSIPKAARWTVFLGAALIGSACILVVTATPGGDAAGSTSDAPSSPTLGWTQTLALTFTPSQTYTPTTTPVTMTAGQALSCVKGPDWKLYEWVAGIAEGETVTLVARAVPEIPDYYVIHKSDGKECWAFGASSTISGSTSGLPVRETPPLPTVSFLIRNQVYVPLCTLLIRKAGDSSWGANRLAAAVALAGEASVSITAGYYDVIVRDCTGDKMMYEAYNRAIGPDDNYRILAVAPDVKFTLRSMIMFDVCWIDVQTPGGAWQKLYSAADGGGTILTADQRDFTLRAGLYKVRFTRCNTVILYVFDLYVYPGMGTISFG